MSGDGETIIIYARSRKKHDDDTVTREGRSITTAKRHEVVQDAGRKEAARSGKVVGRRHTPRRHGKKQIDQVDITSPRANPPPAATPHATASSFRAPASNLQRLLSRERRHRRQFLRRLHHGAALGVAVVVVLGVLRAIKSVAAP